MLQKLRKYLYTYTDLKMMTKLDTKHVYSDILFCNYDKLDSLVIIYD